VAGRERGDVYLYGTTPEVSEDGIAAAEGLPEKVEVSEGVAMHVDASDMIAEVIDGLSMTYDVSGSSYVIAEASEEVIPAVESFPEPAEVSESAAKRINK
jgi:hypothetical protein